VHYPETYYIWSYDSVRKSLPLPSGYSDGAVYSIKDFDKNGFDDFIIRDTDWSILLLNDGYTNFKAIYLDNYLNRFNEDGRDVEIVKVGDCIKWHSESRLFTSTCIVWMTQDSIPLRAAPEQNSQHEIELSKNCSVKILEQSTGWLKIECLKYGTLYQGWVPKKNTTHTSPAYFSK
jgi:hypothetical protein